MDNADETLEALKDVHTVNTADIVAGVRAATKYLGEGGGIITIGSTFANCIPSGFAIMLHLKLLWRHIQEDGLGS